MKEDMDNSEQERMNDKSFELMVESYRMATSQLDMRIQQRDNLGIQLIITFGALLSAMAVDSIILRKICIYAMPLVCLYFCSQLFSSYEVHSRLVFYIKNNLEYRLKKYIPDSSMLWEQYCEYDRKFKKTSKIGARKGYFMIFNVLIPIFAAFLYFIFFLQDQNRFNPFFNVSNTVSLAFFGIMEFLAIRENIHHRGDYEGKMLDLIAKCGYINSNRQKTPNPFKKAVFLDRDGTLHVDKVETRRLEDLEFFDDVFEALRKLRAEGFDLIIVTNQSGIGKGHYSLSEMMAFNDYLLDSLKNNGIEISALYFCPHRNEDACQCKKPKDGMYRRASIELGIDLSKSYMIGDQNLDAYAGLTSGIPFNYIVTTGLYPNESDQHYHMPEDLIGRVEVFKNFKDAADAVIANERKIKTGELRISSEK